MGPRQILWWAALAVCALNLAAMIRRAPILKAESQTPAEVSAQAAARWINRHAEAGAPYTLLTDARDISAPWFHYRLQYLTYPHVVYAVSDNTGHGKLTGNAIYHTAYLVTFEHASQAPLNGWYCRHIWPAATLYTLAQPAPPSPTKPQNARGVLRLLREILGTLAATVAAAIAGLLVLRVTGYGKAFRSVIAKLAFAHLTGLLLISWVAMLTGLAGERLSLIPIYVVFGLLMLGAAVAQRTARQRHAPQPNAAPGGAPPPRIAWFAAGIVILAAVAALWTGWLNGLDWDGYAIWQLKAKAFAIDGDFRVLTEQLRFAYAHLDYPLLTPLATWWLYAHAGAVSDQIAQAGCFTIALDLGALVYGAVRERCQQGSALIACALAIAAPVIVTHAVSGFADVAMAAWLFAAAWMLGEQSAGQSWAPLWICVAGLALTKNEGLAACVSVFALLFLERRMSKRAIDWRGIGLCGAACALAVGPWIGWKLVHGVGSDLFPAHRPPLLLSAIPGRLVITLAAMLRAISRIGPWFPCWGLTGIVILGGIAMVRHRWRETWSFWFLAFCQLVAYTCVYIITPHDLRWQLASSVDRLLAQVMPCAVVAAVIAIGGAGTSPTRSHDRTPAAAPASTG
ncbi:MAG: hypothetical protein KGK12_01170 [Armatimonadetes bacterium]|nr:hypothetical protein [Armatimonadota bacterium]